MKRFGEAERKILEAMSHGERFIFNEKVYEIVISDKPTCSKGEPKTDVYVLAKSKQDEIEIKI